MIITKYKGIINDMVSAFYSVNPADIQGTL